MLSPLAQHYAGVLQGHAAAGTLQSIHPADLHTMLGHIFGGGTLNAHPIINAGGGTLQGAPIIARPPGVGGVMNGSPIINQGPAQFQGGGQMQPYYQPIGR